MYRASIDRVKCACFGIEQDLWRGREGERYIESIQVGLE